MALGGSRRILVIGSRLNGDITDELVKGALEELSKAGAEYKRVIVPGVLEIPAVIRYATRAMEMRSTDFRYSGYVVLGCVLRSDEEPSHFKNVCHETIRGIQDLAIQFSLAVGNGIITADNHTRALELASLDGRNVGGFAAETCLRMIEIKRELGL